jgi:hypothetical protein
MVGRYGQSWYVWYLEHIFEKVVKINTFLASKYTVTVSTGGTLVPGAHPLKVVKMKKSKKNL